MIRTLKVEPLGRTGVCELPPVEVLLLKEVPGVVAPPDVAVTPGFAAPRIAGAPAGVDWATAPETDVAPDAAPIAAPVGPCMPCDSGGVGGTVTGRRTVALAVLPWVKVEVIAGAVDALAVWGVRFWPGSGTIST